MRLCADLLKPLKSPPSAFNPAAGARPAATVFVTEIAHKAKRKSGRSGEKGTVPTMRPGGRRVQYKLQTHCAKLTAPLSGLGYGPLAGGEPPVIWRRSCFCS